VRHGWDANEPAFADGIAEEEQRYAQVLWDIRDLRGETQQALGRLIGWSVSDGVPVRGRRRAS
jgi:hypothetical protein